MRDTVDHRPFRVKETKWVRYHNGTCHFLYTKHTRAQMVAPMTQGGGEGRRGVLEVCGQVPGRKNVKVGVRGRHTRSAFWRGREPRTRWRAEDARVTFVCHFSKNYEIGHKETGRSPRFVEPGGRVDEVFVALPKRDKDACGSHLFWRRGN